MSQVNAMQVMTQYFHSCKAKHKKAEFLRKFGVNVRDNPSECQKIMNIVNAQRKKFGVKFFGSMDKWPKLQDSREIFSFDQMQDALKASGFSIQGNPISDNIATGG